MTPGTEYTFSITRVSDNGAESKPAIASVTTDPLPPVGIRVSDIGSESLSLQWDTPPGEVDSYIVTWSSEGEADQELTTQENSLTISNLKLGLCYFLQVFTQLKNGRISAPAVTSVCTNVPQPDVTVLHVGSDTVTLGVPPIDSSERCKLHINYHSNTHNDTLIEDESSAVDVTGMTPGTEYTFSITRVSDNGAESKPAIASVTTDPLPPVEIRVSDIGSESLSLQWDTPPGEVDSYIVTWRSEGEADQELTTQENSLTISNLKLGLCYFLQVFTQLKNGRISASAVTSVCTNVPQPDVTVLHVGSDTVTLGVPPIDSSERCKLHINYHSNTHNDTLIEDESSAVDVTGLTPGTEYTFSITRVSDNGAESKPAIASVTTDPLPPVGIRVSDIGSESLSLQWDTPPGEVDSYIVKCSSEGEADQELTTETNSLTINNLKLGLRYFLQVFTQLKNGRRSAPAVTSVCTNVPNFQPNESEKDSSFVGVDGQIPGAEYMFSITRVAANGAQWKSDSITVFTDPVLPVKINVSDVSNESVSLHFQSAAGEVKQYIVKCSSEGETDQDLQKNTNSPRPGVCYSLQVSIKLNNGTRSDPAATSASKKTQLESLLEHLGLEQYFRKNLSMSQMLEINERSLTDEPKCYSDLPWCFVKKLLMFNVTARNVKCTSEGDSNSKATSDNLNLDLNNLIASPVSGDRLNPLDIITALFLCSDGFVQQELTLKMSMCQFSVPLLLPNCDTQQCTLMLWAMRDIVKKYRPQSLSESKGFKEDRIVISELPMISFVRLGESSLSKSEILNKLLSSSQQYHDTFVHHNMECGDSPRRISNGLVEISWYLPCGNKNMDIFSEPVAVANLRGDAASFETQYSFLCQTSAAVFVFSDNLESEYTLLNNQNHKSQIFLVGNKQGTYFNADALKQGATRLGLQKKNLIIKTQQKSYGQFIKTIKSSINDIVQNSKMKMKIEQMADIAHELGIMVDEDCPECQMAKRNADAITAEIQDTLKYKENQLPRQGQIWKQLTMLEKEEFRLQNLGSENIENYKSKLQKQKTQLRAKQNSSDMSDAMTCFINAISRPGTERCYFLKWMRMNLDNLSRDKLSDLRELYKQKCESSENKEEIKDIDKQLSSSSLGTEHFFREIGQIYEASVCLPETNPSRQQLQHLPKLCAQLLLDGFPVELVDGDASNIPLRWVSDVLSQLNEMVSPKNKVLVVTVLGVQSTGKSTLLNTMFGVQFAVSSGRCTRGAFMLLIRINEGVKTVLNCDFMMIIDTEGLKSPELSQLDNSYEHDNELATLVLGLSDITIVNIAMENITDMKDILQIVVHAFLRMKEIGKKPKCQFVHQNVSDVSAHEKNSRDRKLLLEQLNEMTQAAARMEKKEKNKSFTDVMEYDPDTGNWYIPGLWNGNPPMAPVNAGYSEAVYDLKKNVIKLLGNHQSSGNNIMEFTEWMRSLWNAVKHENFIFSFRNSLVADAYMKLCTEFNKWEWEFKKDMYTWVTQAETSISNFGTIAAKYEISDIKELLTWLKTEASTKLIYWEEKLLDNLTQYFKQKEGHVCLVEGYREEFSNSAKNLRKEMKNSVFNQLTAAAEIKQGMREVDKIKKNHTKELEKAVSSLIDECREKNFQMTNKELDKEFDKMWKQTMSKVTFSKPQPKDIFTSVFNCLRINLSHKGSHACELLSQRRLEDCGFEPFKVTVEGRLIQFLHKMQLQKMSDRIIDACKQAVVGKTLKHTNYHDTDIQEILHLIDEKLQNNQDVDTDITFEVFLKQHICGFAARNFQKMHEEFLHMNDPHTCLNQNKDKFCADFKYLFHVTSVRRRQKNSPTDA
ncbi:interferon-induced very large GTPase 1-like [Betta splendens]|uniref:Interferon-induced very large GTPase 1-like n=1 Tax=Betta splendens TaxID=158456 RepID=A0A6P7KM22_BETSP|nr:interferon-induced very large GTPase 1-like [Betta splendens]